MVAPVTVALRARTGTEEVAADAAPSALTRSRNCVR